MPRLRSSRPWRPLPLPPWWLVKLKNLFVYMDVCAPHTSAWKECIKTNSETEENEECSFWFSSYRLYLFPSLSLSLSRLVVYVIGTSTILATFETTTSHHTLWFSQVRSPVRPNDSVHQALAYSIFPRRLPLALQEHARLVSIKFVLSPSQRYRSQVIKGNFCSWDRKRKKSEIKGMNLRLVRWVARSPFRWERGTMQFQKEKHKAAKAGNVLESTKTCGDIRSPTIFSLWSYIVLSMKLHNPNNFWVIRF